jgi:hypothetical protein
LILVVGNHSDDFTPYFELIDKEVIDDKKTFSAKLFELEILRADDTKAEVDYFTSMVFL